MSKAVSFSRHGLYKKCPASYEWQYILGNKREDGPGPAAQRGTRIHNSIEQFFLAGEPLDREVPSVVTEWLMEHYFAMEEGRCEARPEMAFCLDKDWNPLDDFDHEDGFIRGYMDNVFIYPDRVLVHEYKTGQQYEDHADQKALYAMVCLLLFDNINEVTVEGIYIDGKKRVPATYSRDHLITMKFHWKREIEKMFIPIYPARPGRHCSWCPKSKTNDGPCKVG